jgi:peptidoglycan/LPS O-acetylase OafA/YrhL
VKGANPAFARRLAGIEGLRALAIASVFVFHVWFVSPPLGHPFESAWLGKHVFLQLQNGVTLFFVLSGFLLYLPFASAALRERARPEFGAYLQNRALRILPAYWVILLLTAVVLQSARIYHAHSAAIGAMHSPKLLVENGLLLQNYRPVTLATGIVPAWSLAIEVVYYLALPLLVVAALWLARRATTHRQRIMAMLFPAAALAVIGVASSVLGPNTGRIYAQHWTGVWRLSFLPHAQLFAPGLALAVARVEYQDGRLRLPSWWRRAAAVAGILIAAVVIELSTAGTITVRAEVGWIAIACGLLLALAVLPPAHSRSRLLGTLEAPALVGTGLISYSVYLWHVPVMLWLRNHGLTSGAGVPGFALNLVLAATVTGALAWLTYRYVEKPALRLKSRGRTMRGEPTSSPNTAAPRRDPQPS